LLEAITNLLINLSLGNILLLGLLGGLITALLNSLGTLPILFLKAPSQRSINIGLGFSAGVMLAASFTSLILPGIEIGGLIPVVIGIIIGAITVSLSDMFIPHLHFLIGKDSLISSRMKAIWLFAIAVTIHNMPEGLAVGVGFGAGGEYISNAVALMMGIGLQNIPEGLAIGFSLLATGRYTRLRSFMVGNISGFVEIPLAFIGAALVAIMARLLPYAMGFAAGAMIFVISDEIVPETHRLGHQRTSSYGLIIGLLVMLSLDILLTP